MDEINSHLIGTTEGYRPGAIFTLEDGTIWEQTAQWGEFVLRDRPKVRVWRDSAGLTMLDLEGTGTIVQVRKWTGKRWAGPGAY